MMMTMCWKFGTSDVGVSVGGTEGVDAAVAVSVTGTGLSVNVAEGTAVSVGTGGNGAQATGRTRKTIQNLEQDI